MSSTESDPKREMQDTVDVATNAQPSEHANKTCKISKSVEVNVIEDKIVTPNSNKSEKPSSKPVLDKKDEHHPSANAIIAENATSCANTDDSNKDKCTAKTTPSDTAKDKTTDIVVSETNKIKDPPSRETIVSDNKNNLPEVASLSENSAIANHLAVPDVATPDTNNKPDHGTPKKQKNDSSEETENPSAKRRKLSVQDYLSRRKAAQAEPQKTSL